MRRRQLNQECSLVILGGNGRERDESNDPQETEELASDGKPESDSDLETDLSRDDLVKLVVEKEQVLLSKQEELEKMKDKVLRSLAEMENVKERTRRESENSKKFAIQVQDQGFGTYQGAPVHNMNITSVQVSTMAAVGEQEPLCTKLEGTSKEGHSEMGAPANYVVQLCPVRASLGADFELSVSSAPE